ncbi:MAG: hypothetical protein GY714_23195 [Desulfobacterales bacterium]|nr:hypothetical protein [Desulfobacterales bacterium]MCP4160575.1 hypothetical protein [Deltaproteobacteria bacterium]
MYYEALYQPKSEEKISPKAKHFIGQRIALQEGFQKDTKAKKKQVYYIATPNFGLIPNFDLQNIKSISFNIWKELRDEATHLLDDK